MNNPLDFSGKVALVTGAASGMGLATAQAFAEAGAAVVLADFKEDAVKAATEKLIAAGHKALAVRCDVSEDAQVAAMVDRAVAAFGRLDAAFNNAGVMAVQSGGELRGRPRPYGGWWDDGRVIRGPTRSATVKVMPREIH